MRLRYSDERDASHESPSHVGSVRRGPAIGPVRPIHGRRARTLEASERALLQSVERGEWATVARFPEIKARYARGAKATLRRPRQV